MKEETHSPNDHWVADSASSPLRDGERDPRQAVRPAGWRPQGAGPDGGLESGPKHHFILALSAFDSVRGDLYNVTRFRGQGGSAAR